MHNFRRFESLSHFLKNKNPQIILLQPDPGYSVIRWWQALPATTAAALDTQVAYSLWTSMAEAPPPPLQILARPYSPGFKV